MPTANDNQKFMAALEKSAVNLVEKYRKALLLESPFLISKQIKFGMHMHAVNGVAAVIG